MTDSSTLPIEYDVNEAYIAKETDMYKDIVLTPDDKDSYAMVMSGLKAHRGIRLSIEKKRKSNNESAQTYIETNNAKAKELHALNDPGEQRLKDIRKVEDDRIAEIEAEAFRKEQARITGILAMIQEIKNCADDAGLGFMSAIELRDRLNLLNETTANEENFMEFKGQASITLERSMEIVATALTERTRLDKEDAARKLEDERLEEVRVKQEATQKRLDDERKKQEAKAQEELDNIAKARRKVAEEVAKLEADIKAEQDRKDREDFELKAKEEARIQAEKDSKEKTEREAREKINHERREKEEADRQEALKPDKEKIKDWAASFNEDNNPTPKIDDEQLKDVLRIALEYIDLLLKNVLEDVEGL